MSKNAYGLSHAKIIFLGEHSAVYKKPAIVFPVPKIKVVSWVRNEGDHLQLKSDYYSGNVNEMPESMKGLNKLITTLNNDLNTNKIPLTIEIKSDIPLGKGMGSSAATASAVIKAYFKFFENKLTNKVLKQYTDIEEHITHGNPSGIDAKTVSSNFPILFENNHFYDFKLITDAFLVIADTGSIGNTKIAVENVKQRMRKNESEVSKIINHLGTIVEKAKSFLTNNDKKNTGLMMNQAQNDLKELGVSTPVIEKLITVALENGALGAKLTGSGLGGCIIALATNKQLAANVAKALLNNGAKQAWIQSLKELND